MPPKRHVSQKSLAEYWTSSPSSKSTSGGESTRIFHVKFQLEFWTWLYCTEVLFNFLWILKLVTLHGSAARFPLNFQQWIIQEFSSWNSTFGHESAARFFLNFQLEFSTWILTNFHLRIVNMSREFCYWRWWDRRLSNFKYTFEFSSIFQLEFCGNLIWFSCQHSFGPRSQHRGYRCSARSWRCTRVVGQWDFK